MTEKAYAALSVLRGEFRALVSRWTEEHPYLPGLQERLRLDLGYSDYRVETPLVYNLALDDIGPDSEIRIVLVADNPGKNEQLARNRRYLVGQSGRLAEGWMRRELGMDLRRQVAILNKTPLHTPKTAELRALLSLAGPDRVRLESLLRESQVAMADLACGFCSAMGAVLWVSGLGELRKGGLFQAYRDEMARRLAASPALRDAGAWAFNHFSMNRFSIELRKKARPGRPVASELSRIGTENRLRVFGV